MPHSVASVSFTFIIGLILVNSLVVVAKLPSGGKLITLTDDNWTEMLKDEWMVEFFAPWCPACRALEPDWRNFAGWSDDLAIKVAAVDVTENPGLSGRFMVTALPTIYHVKDGVFRQYKGSRETNAFVSFVEDKKWMQIEPVSKWTAPDTVQMTVVSHFFKISMALRSIHNRLVEDYGVPYWVSYILFAFSTILVGALLGLLIVCFIDVLFPAKSYAEQKRDEDLSRGSDGDSSDLLDDRGSRGGEQKPAGEGQEVRKRGKKVVEDQEEEEEEDEES